MTKEDICHLVPKNDVRLWREIEDYYFSKGYNWAYEKHNKRWIWDRLSQYDCGLVVSPEDMCLYTTYSIDNYKHTPFNIHNLVPEELFEL